MVLLEYIDVSHEKGEATMAMTTDRLEVVLPADWVRGPQQGNWTYDDYAALPDDGKKYEIVEGVLLMAPAPTGPHQDVIGEIFSYLRTYVKLTGRGLVRFAPFTVQLSPGNVFQPDVFVVLNEHLHRVQEKKMLGAPDLVVEVASPSTATYDRLNKYDKYARAGVPEYWIIKIEERTVEVMVLENGQYRSLGIFQGEQTLPSSIVPDLPVRVEQFFV